MDPRERSWADRWLCGLIGDEPLGARRSVTVMKTVDIALRTRNDDSVLDPACISMGAVAYRTSLFGAGGACGSPMSRTRTRRRLSQGASGYREAPERRPEASWSPLIKLTADRAVILVEVFPPARAAGRHLSRLFSAAPGLCRLERSMS